MKKILVIIILSLLPAIIFARCGSVNYKVHGIVIDDQSERPIEKAMVTIFLGMQGSAKPAKSDSSGMYNITQHYWVLGKYIDGVGDVCDFNVEHIA